MFKDWRTSPRSVETPGVVPGALAGFLGSGLVIEGLSTIWSARLIWRWTGLELKGAPGTYKPCLMGNEPPA